MESSYMDATVSDISSLADLSIAGNEDVDCAMLEEIKSLYEEVGKEYKRYVSSEMLVSCLRNVPEHPDLVPKEFADKLNKMIINTEVLESLSVKDKNRTKYDIFGLEAEDLLELQSEALIKEEELCLKSAVNTLLQKKCTAFRDKQSKIDKECKILSSRRREGIFDKMNKILKSLHEIAQKMELCESLIQSISELQQKYVQVEDKWKDIMMDACQKVEDKLELVNAEARILNCNVVHAVCSENEHFLKAVEILQSVLKEEISNAEHELKVLNETLKQYETAEKDPAFKNTVKMYNKIQKKHKHLNWCLESMHGK